MKVQISPYYTAYTLGASEHVIEACTVKDALCTLLERFPQLLVFLLDNDKAECQKLSIELNGEVLLDYHDALLPCTCTDVLSLAPGTPTGSFGIDAFVLAVISIVISVLSFAANILMAALADSIAEPSVNEGNLGDSATYTFNGIQNTTASGTSLQIAYGKVRTGGHIISLFLSNGSTPAVFGNFISEAAYQWLSYQIALCEGEIQDVSDIQIAKYPASFFNSVDVYPAVPDYLRRGTPSQTIMPEFSQIRNTTSITRKVLTRDTPIPAAVATATFRPYIGYVPFHNNTVFMLEPVTLAWVADVEAPNG